MRAKSRKNDDLYKFGNRVWVLNETINPYGLFKERMKQWGVLYKDELIKRNN